MLASPAKLLTAAAVWAVAAALHGWPDLPGRWRRAFALAASGLGLVMLVLAFRSEGSREVAVTGQFLLGEPAVLGRASASASLPFYVVTAACLLLGTAALAVPDHAAHALATRPVRHAIGVAMGVTVLRILLEKVAAPRSWSYLVGVTWLAPVAGAYFFWKLPPASRRLTAVAARLLVYGLAVRAFVAAVMVVATRFRLDTHYDVTRISSVEVMGRSYTFMPGSWSQVALLGVVPQLTFWVAFTVAAGLVGAGGFRVAQIALQRGGGIAAGAGVAEAAATGGASPDR